MSILLLIVNKIPTSMAAIGKAFKRIPEDNQYLQNLINAKEDKPSFKDFAKGNPSMLAPNSSL